MDEWIKEPHWSSTD